MIIDGKTGGYRRAQAEISPGTGGDIAGHGRRYSCPSLSPNSPLQLQRYGKIHE